MSKQIKPQMTLLHQPFSIRNTRLRQEASYVIRNSTPVPLQWGNPTNGLARLCAIYALAVLVLVDTQTETEFKEWQNVKY
ncbi:MAG: hypothetical protein V7L25_11950 [Nostoc sp.]|uniref:hypothetical protein n=1 Tax=Nostoc sp. TaxID=1180 RepID=UPI002FF2C0BF